MERDAALGPVGDIGIMSDHDYGAPLPMQFFKKGHDFVPGVAIESSGGLVGQDQRCLIYERSSDGDALLLATRQLAGPMIFAMCQANAF